ncbi:tyrosine-protein phosphatase [Lactovum miscens]|uniref:Tyrosine-protein phosphatase n=1 Tax=Lactovum miscens TaxID=190387 RepID=A0A841C9C3_9LACT|nr:CpsB/CapC family capsule biosynthesis tyrosine phosphatase [Lactovum miscens]MBB5887989.1 protein-tyrosine phosphatase [Lactovum miscens]
MIDIHCHILPGIDDGAKTLEDTLTMLKVAIEEGITVITATPHHNPEYKNERPLILQKVQEVEQIIEENNLPIQVLPGQEVRAYGEVIADFKDNKLLTAADNSRFVLIEFPSDHVPGYASQLFYQMQSNGFQPILVHPERNSEIIENPNILYDLVNKGALSQITASSVTGHFGRKIQKLTYQIVENNLAHFIASDAHNVTSRSFKMKEALKIIGDEFGFELSEYYKNNSKQVIIDGQIYPDKPSKIKNKKILGLF